MSWTDGVDSHYEYVKTRILTLNPNRSVKGLLSAQDWPSKPVIFDAFYLLDLGEEPVGKQCYSASTPIKFHLVQWVWINRGTDLKTGERKANRGDKYRIMQTMKGELTNGLFPGFCEKFSWALDSTDKFVSTQKTPREFISWPPVQCHEKWNKDDSGGIGYGAGSIRITDMLDEIIS
jgi:hypothetical protein